MGRRGAAAPAPDRRVVGIGDTATEAVTLPRPVPGQGVGADPSDTLTRHPRGRPCTTSSHARAKGLGSERTDAAPAAARERVVNQAPRPPPRMIQIATTTSTAYPKPTSPVSSQNSPC